MDAELFECFIGVKIRICLGRQIAFIGGVIVDVATSSFEEIPRRKKAAVHDRRTSRIADVGAVEKHRKKK